jgi:hypothetical protein
MDQRTPTSELKTGYPPGEHAEISAQKARQGVTLGTMRYVLGISLGLSVVAILIAYSLFVVFHR